MAKVTYREIRNKAEAMEFCNELLGYFQHPYAPPVKLPVDFLEKRTSSDPQRQYYWAVVVEMQCNYFKNDVLKLAEFVFKAVRGGLLTRDFIHTLNKFLYNGGKSTEKLRTDKREIYHKAIREDMLHQCGLLIPEPDKDYKINNNQ